MSVVLAIDPGPVRSGWAVVDSADHRPLAFNKTPNDEFLADLRSDIVHRVDLVAIEQVESYGARVGREVFDTVFWAGRFAEATATATDREALLVGRRKVKLHLCGRSAAKDADVVQALVDLFAPGQRNHGKGTKLDPGWFYGFRVDVWQAYALGVYVVDTMPALRLEGVE